MGETWISGNKILVCYEIMNKLLIFCLIQKVLFFTIFGEKTSFGRGPKELFKLDNILHVYCTYKYSTFGGYSKTRFQLSFFSLHPNARGRQVKVFRHSLQSYDDFLNFETTVGVRHSRQSHSTKVDIRSNSYVYKGRRNFNLNISCCAGFVVLTATEFGRKRKQDTGG